MPLIGIPLIIHLFNRRQINTIEFSSIQFLQKLKKESIKRLNILHIILLVIRTLIILCIILMASRPFTKGLFSNWIDDASSTFTAIIVDDSYSMMREYGDNELSKVFSSIVNKLPANSTVQTVNIVNSEQFYGIASKLKQQNIKHLPTYGSANVTDALSKISLQGKEYANKEIFIITDKAGLLQVDINMVESLIDWNHYVYTFSNINNNLSVENVTIQNEIILQDVPIEIFVKIVNNGIQNMENRLVQLIIDDISVGQQLVALNSNETKVILFKTAISKPNTLNASIELQNDDRNSDNSFFFQINATNKTNIAILSNKNQDHQYFTSAIDALNKKSQIYNYKIYNSGNFRTWNPNNSSIVFVFGNEMLTEYTGNRLFSYINNGGIIMCIPSSDDTSFSLFPNNLKSNESTLTNLGNSFQEIDFDTIKDEQLEDIFDDEIKNIKIFNYFDLKSNNVTPTISLENSSILFGKLKIGQGEILILTSALSLKWNNFILKGSFIPFIHFLMHQNLQSSQFENDLRVGDLTKVSINTNFLSSSQFVNISNPVGEIQQYPLSESTVEICQINYPGFYKILNKGGEELNSISANIPKMELENNKNIEPKLFKNTVFIEDYSNLDEIIDSARIGKELWRMFLYLLVLLVSLEMLLSNVYRRKSN